MSVRYGERLVLDRVDLTLRRGEILSLIGPNGAGKSTLVRLVLGILKPNSGRVVRVPNLRVGYMPQRLNIDPTLPLTVERFLSLPHRQCDLDIANVLQEVGVADLSKRQMHTLSGGEFQRVLLARALLRDPDLLVLDEPGQGVDFIGQADFFRLIDKVRRERRCGVLLVSHELHLVMSATDRVLCLNRHVCCSGHPEAVGRDPAYAALFGPGAADALAVYRHRHDHEHDLAGKVVHGHPHRADATPLDADVP